MFLLLNFPVVTVIRQSSEYVSSEDLLRYGSLAVNSTKVESESELNQQSLSLEAAADPLYLISVIYCISIKFASCMYVQICCKFLPEKLYKLV